MRKWRNGTSLVYKTNKWITRKQKFTSQKFLHEFRLNLMIQSDI